MSKPYSHIHPAERICYPTFSSWVLQSAARRRYSTLCRSIPKSSYPRNRECLFFSSLSEFRGIGYDVVLNGLITRSLAEYESLFFRGLKKRAMKVNARQKSPMSDETRRALTRLFAEDITRLEALIGRDLSRWKAF